ncbi:hypothetical protein M436DRAFT_65967 [Aureobasidium namibiae CBS 147.97]|uniref:Uncharacterized protein n=1 Tax=Aureobasidium namibiae CBS 147.97 TaxID=1043004 RepID=A0A074WDV6_9PEZI
MVFFTLLGHGANSCLVINKGSVLFTIPGSPDVECFHFVCYVENTAGRLVLMLSQHPLLAQSAAARATLLSEWYHTNHFTVSFDICLPSTSRSDLERAFDILGPSLAACLMSPVAGIITPRLHIHCGKAQHGATFASMVQWFGLFYNGVLSEGRYAGIRTSMSTAAPNPAQFELTWDDSSQAAFTTYKFAAIRVLHGLRKEAARLTADPNKDIDVPRHVYNWLVDSRVPAVREDLVPEAKVKICRSIGPTFQKLGYDAATRLYTSLELMARTRSARRPSADAARRYSLVQEQDQVGVETSSHKRTRSSSAAAIKPPAATSGRGLHKRSRPARKDVKDTGSTSNPHAANGSVPTHQGAGEGPMSTRQDTGSTNDPHAANGSVPTHQGVGGGLASTHQGAADTSHGPAFYGYTSHWACSIFDGQARSILLSPVCLILLSPGWSAALRMRESLFIRGKHFSPCSNSGVQIDIFILAAQRRLAYRNAPCALIRDINAVYQHNAQRSWSVARKPLVIYAEPNFLKGDRHRWRIVDGPRPEERPTVTEPHAGDNDQFKLVESTAPALADGDTKARFQCPLGACACHLSEAAKLRDLWVHCVSPDHALALYHQCHYRCEFGCLLGFPDTLSRFEHYGGQRCGAGSQDAKRGLYLMPYTNNRAAAAFKSISDYVRGEYIEGSSDHGTLWRKGSRSPHCANVLRRFCMNENIVLAI